MLEKRGVDTGAVGGSAVRCMICGVEMVQVGGTVACPEHGTVTSERMANQKVSSDTSGGQLPPKRPRAF